MGGTVGDRPQRRFPAETPKPQFRPLWRVFVILLRSCWRAAALPNLPWQPMNIPATDIPATDETINLATPQCVRLGAGAAAASTAARGCSSTCRSPCRPRARSFFCLIPPSIPAPRWSCSPSRSRRPPGAACQGVPGGCLGAAVDVSVAPVLLPGWEAVIDGCAAAQAAAGPLGLAGGRPQASMRSFFGSTPRDGSRAITLG